VDDPGPDRVSTRTLGSPDRAAYEHIQGAFREVDGRRVKVKRTSLFDPGEGAQAVDAADGTIWILESEPA
jgi:hypothetical protein